MFRWFRLRIALCFGCAALLRPGFIAAEVHDTADSVYVVPPIVVEAPRVATVFDDIFRRPGFVAVIDLSDRRARLEDLSAVLSQSVGVRTRQYGGLGSFATASIRGSSAQQVDVYLDGVPLNDAYMGMTNLADLPIGGLARIEVYRGAMPTSLGGAPIGGAVNLVTTGEGPGDGTRVEALVSAGSFDTTRQTASLWTRLKAIRLFLHGSHTESSGEFKFTDDNGTPQNLDDDARTARSNNDWQTLNLIARGSAGIDRLGKLSISHNLVARRNGVPGIGSYQSLTARAERTRSLTHASMLPAAWLGGRLNMSVDAFYATSNEKFQDLDGDIGLIRQDTDNTFTSYGGSFKSAFEVPHAPITVEYFYEDKRETYLPHTNVPVARTGPEGTRRSHAHVGSADVTLPLGLVATGSVRYQRHENEFWDQPVLPALPPSPQGVIVRSRETPAAGFRWQLTSFLALKGNWAKAYRMPTLLELYGNTGSVTGNSSLQPEFALNRDIGAILSLDRWWRLRKVFLELVYLDNEVSNLILFFPNSQHTSRPANITSARIRGLEMSTSALWQDGLRLAANLTLLDTENTGPIPYYRGNKLPSRPEVDFAAFVDFRRDRWKVSYEYHLLGENYLNPANLERVPARSIHNLFVELRPLFPSVSLTLGGQNLTDNQISDVGGFPLPGRSVCASLAYRP